MKIAVVTDSNSGITQKEAEKLGIIVLPMPFMINEQVFFEDIDLSQEAFYKRMAEGARYYYLPAGAKGCAGALGQAAEGVR